MLISMAKERAKGRAGASERALTLLGVTDTHTHAHKKHYRSVSSIAGFCFNFITRFSLSFSCSFLLFVWIASFGFFGVGFDIVFVRDLLAEKIG